MQPGQPLQAVTHGGQLGLQLARVVHMLPDATAAALREVHTSGCHTFGRGCLHRDDICFHMPALHPTNAHTHGFAWHRA